MNGPPSSSPFSASQNGGSGNAQHTQQQQQQQTLYTTPMNGNNAWPPAGGAAVYGGGPQQQQSQPQQGTIGLFEPDFELMKRQFDSVSITGAPGPAVVSQQQQPQISTSAGPSPNVGYPQAGQSGFDAGNEGSKKTRYNSAPQQPGNANGQSQGLFGQGNGAFVQNTLLGGMPGFPDYSAYLAAAAAAGISNPAAQAAFAQATGAPFNASLMAQQGSQGSSSASEAGGPFINSSNQHQRALSMGGSGQGGFGQNPTIGLFPQNPGSPSSLISPFSNSLSPLSSNPNGASYNSSLLSMSQSPSAQAMSAMSSLSGNTGLSSPSMGNLVGPSGTVQGLGMGGMFGLGVPNLGGLGMPMPGMMGSPALSSAALSPQLSSMSWLDASSPLAQWSSQLSSGDPVANAAATAAAAAALASANGQSPFLDAQLATPQMDMELMRTVYVGNLPGDASVDELLSLVRYGPIENVKILPDKSCAFISFLDPGIAAAFHNDAMLRKIALHDQELKIGWGKATAIPPQVMQAVTHFGATRNVYLGNLDDSLTEVELSDDLSRYGHIDQVKIVRDKNIGFVHFLSIGVAMRVVTELPKEPKWAGKRVNYGKDRCAYVPRNQHQQQQHNQMAAHMAVHAAAQLSPMMALSPMPMSPSLSPMSFSGGFADPNIQAGSRCIYLGNLHPDTTCEDICNTIRGGILESIKLIPEKHICFIHFVMPESAFALYQLISQNGLMVRNRRLKVGWGKNTGPCPPGITAIVNNGGSRNVYIGNIDDFDTFTVERIKEDLSEYGEIEQVNALVDKSCAFTNYTNIKYAVKAIEGLKRHPVYSRFKIAYGKDRVGNIARQPMNRRTGGYRSHGPVQSYNLGPSSGSQQSHHSSSNNRHQSPRPSREHEGSPEDGKVANGQVGLGSSVSSAAGPDGRTASPQLEAVAGAAAAVQSAEQKQGLA